MFEPKLTEYQRAAIFDKCLRGAKTKDLATEYKVSETTIRVIKYDPKRLADAQKVAESHQAFAKIRIHKAAMKGIEKEHEILDREVPEGDKGTSLLYLQHQVATSMMDRDGLKAPDKSEQKLEIMFGTDGPDLGMPEESGAVGEDEEMEANEE